MKSRFLRDSLFYLACLCLLGCGRQAPEWGGWITQEGATIVVRNPSIPRYPGQVLTLEEELSIGQRSGPDEYMFSRINGLDVDKDGNIYAIENIDSAVRVFNKDGLFLRTIGRKGQGPGEFQRPQFIHITKAGEACVGDYLGAAVIYFSRSGEYLRRKPMSRPFLPIKQDSRGNLLGMEIPAPPPLGGKIINKYDPDLKILAKIATEETGERGVFDIGKPSCYAAMTFQDHIVWGDSKEYILYELDPTGKLVRKIVREGTPQRIDAADRRGYEERYAEPLKAGMKIRFRDHYPAFADILTDDQGRIFIRTYERVGGEESRFYLDVYNPDGIYIAKLDMPANLDRNSVWKGDRLYTVESDPEGFPVLRRYRVKWKA